MSSKCRLYSIRSGFFFLVVLVLALAASAAVAGETGVLKLKVRNCASTTWMSGAKLDVEIYRPGVGVVDSFGDATDAYGYVEFEMEGLESEDEARVTITPSGMDPDDSHVYVWVASRLRSPGYWDLGYQADSLCEDGWYDQPNNIILALYH